MPTSLPGAPTAILPVGAIAYQRETRLVHNGLGRTESIAQVSAGAALPVAPATFVDHR